MADSQSVISHLFFVSRLQIGYRPYAISHAPMNDLALFLAMRADLADYLASDTLFWQLSGPSTFPKLSLGYLLLTRARLTAASAQLAPAQQTEFAQADQFVTGLLAQKPVAAEKKAALELRTRVNLWAQFLDECVDDSQACAEGYPHDVIQRVIAALLVAEFPRVGETSEALRLASLDARLRGLWRPGAFLWPLEYQSAFPSDDFWFLYGRLK